jgi:hypothetical protein
VDFAMIAAIVVGALVVVGVLSDAPTRLRTSDTQPAPAGATKAEMTASVVEKSVTAWDVCWTVTGSRLTSELHKGTPPPQTETGNFVVSVHTSGFKAQLRDTDPTVNEKRYVELGF